VHPSRARGRLLTFLAIERADANSMAVSHDVYALFASLIRDRLAVFGVAPFDVDASRARTSANAHELQCSTSQTMSTIADAYAAMMSVFETTLGEDDNDCFVLRFLAVNAERAGSDRTLVDEFAIFRRDEVEIDADADPAIDARAVFASKQATQAVLFAPLLRSGRGSSRNTVRNNCTHMGAATRSSRSTSTTASAQLSSSSTRRPRCRFLSRSTPSMSSNRSPACTSASSVTIARTTAACIAWTPTRCAHC
jgi:hypothetical protein